jgi:hypothetical protein
VDMISGPGYSRPYMFWRSGEEGQRFNVFGYKNAEVDRLFDLLRASATNEAVTRSATEKLQRTFADDPPALFLAWNQRTRAVRREFRVVSEPDRDPLLTLGRWTPEKTEMVSRR